MDKPHQVLIIGTGPAGLTAALYAARAQLNPVVLVGDHFGGQIAWTYVVENYPGVSENPSGVELVERIRQQAERFGAKLLYQTARSVDFQRSPFSVTTDNETLFAKTVIVCSGARPRKLGVPGEEEFIGKGVSYCSVCDGPFFKDKKVVVIGGGNSALDEGNFLTRFATEVTVIHRRDRFRAEQLYIDQAKKNSKMEFMMDTVAVEIIGQSKVQGIKVKNVKTDEESKIETDGVFIFIGQIPNTEIFEGQLEMDEKGYLKVDDHWQTSIPGIFAAGECEDWRWKQMVTACGDACKAALAAERFLTEKER